MIEYKADKINNRISSMRDEYIEKFLQAYKDATIPLNLTVNLDAEVAYSSADFIVIAASTNYESHTCVTALKLRKICGIKAVFYDMDGI